MKLILLARILCVFFTLSLVSNLIAVELYDPYNFLHYGDPRVGAESDIFNQYRVRVDQILKAIDHCNRTTIPPEHFISDNETMVLLQNNPKPLYANPFTKCFMNCVMRNTSVLNNEGLQVETYMRIVKQLRMNYTHYYADTGRVFYKEEVAAAVKKYASVEKGYETIEAYEWAANDCRDMRDHLNNDPCQIAWLIAQCVVYKSGEIDFNNPFFPFDLTFHTIYGTKYVPKLKSHVSAVKRKKYKK